MGSAKGVDSGLAVVILAAGEGRRMKSSLPKVLHEVAGKPMIGYVLDAVRKVRPAHAILVAHPSGDLDELGTGVRTVYQRRRLGTGDAVAKARAALSGFAGDVLVLCGDTPFMTSRTLRKLVQKHRRDGSAVTLLSARLDDPGAYGRIVRSEKGGVQRIVEHKDCSRKERAIREVNSGTYVFTARDLFAALRKLKSDNVQQEFYLTDCVEILKDQGKGVGLVAVDGEDEIAGINSRVDLAKAEKRMRRNINERWMAKGVTIVDPDSAFIDSTVRLEADAVIEPFTFIRGTTRIGTGSVIGPATRVEDAVVGANVVIENSVVKGARIGEGASIGPFSYLRPGTRVGKAAKVGSFVEVKQSRIGTGSKVPHLSYLGDATVGHDANVGAGTITCNYDGKDKFKTIIGDEALIGSDTQLVAPVKIGRKAATGAGSTITRDVPDRALAVERTDQKVVKNWKAKKARARKQTGKAQGKSKRKG